VLTIPKHFSQNFINNFVFFILVEIIQLKEVAKEFSRTKVLENINLTINEGDLFGIIGASGSGKTTLLNLIAGFIPPSEGDVVYFSKVDHQPKSLSKNFHRVKKHIGFMHQHMSFYPKLTIKENVLHFGRLYGMNESTLIENAKSLLHFTKLYKHRTKIAGHLSGGMQKRLDITCSLIHRPKILLLDEPTADLDPILQDDVVQLIQEVNKQGITIIIASHHLESVEKICNKLAIMHEGTIQRCGLVEEVRKPFLREHITININAGQEKQRLMELSKTLAISKIVDLGDRLVLYPDNAEYTISQLLRIVNEEKMYLHDIDFRKPSLNEIFHQITTKPANDQPAPPTDQSDSQPTQNQTYTP